jgi:hypothetical protein
MTDAQKQVEAMIKKAGESTKADDAMKFSQAALNAANAMCSLDHINKPK